MDNTQYIALVVLIILVFLYLVQIVMARRQANLLDDVTLSCGETKSIRLSTCIKLYDGGARNIWIFLILAAFLPIFLNSLSDLHNLLMSSADRQTTLAQSAPLPPTALFGEDGPLLPPELLQQYEEYYRGAISQRNTSNGDSFTKWIYFVCISSIGVLITLEFSYLHSLRKSAPEWIPLLLSALVLDLVALILFVFIISHPQTWGINPPLFLTKVVAFVTTLIALGSSLLILIFARTAAALHDGQVSDEIIVECATRDSAENQM